MVVAPVADVVDVEWVGVVPLDVVGVTDVIAIGVDVAVADNTVR